MFVTCLENYNNINVLYNKIKINNISNAYKTSLPKWNSKMFYLLK